MGRTRSRAPWAAVVLAVGAWTAAGAANLHGGNGIYRVVISDGAQAFKCGTWTAVTGPLHPLGPDLDLLFSLNHTPINTSYTTLHSYASGRDYTTTSMCTALCVFAGQPEIEPIERDGTTVGYRLAWTIDETPPGADPSVVRFVQEVVVEGPVDGTETIDDSVVRETHIVENLGPGVFAFGLRKLWDVAIDFLAEEAPLIGDCRSPEAGCNRSLNLRPSSFLSALGPAEPRYPDNVILRADPPTLSCPWPAEPGAPGDCTGPDPWIVAATVRGAGNLDPAPDPPQILQFNAWTVQFGECFLAEVVDPGCYADGIFDFDNSSLAYIYGVTANSALRLRPQQSRSFTQYLALDLATCPQIIDGN